MESPGPAARPIMATGSLKPCHVGKSSTSEAPAAVLPVYALCAGLGRDCAGLVNVGAFRNGPDNDLYRPSRDHNESCEP